MKPCRGEPRGDCDRPANRESARSRLAEWPCTHLLSESSMPNFRRPQAQIELGQGTALLDGIGMHPTRIRNGPDPPDVVAEFDNFPAISIEITEYHPGNDRVGMELRWNQLRYSIDEVIKRRPHWKGMGITLYFQDPLIPQQHFHHRIVDDLIRCVDHIGRLGWVSGLRRRVLFRDEELKPPLPETMHEWGFLPSADWPAFSLHIKQIDLVQESYSYYLPVSAFEPQTAWCSPFAAAFRAIIKRKDALIERAIKTGKYSELSPNLWLLIITNSPKDMESHIFADPSLPYIAAECLEVFTSSYFDKIWLMDHSRPHRLQLLHPYADIPTSEF